jgi:competence protein ComEC
MELLPQAKPRIVLHRLPLVGLAIAVMIGITAGRYVPLQAGLWALAGAIAIIASVAAMVWLRFRPAAGLALCAAAMMLAGLYTQLVYYSTGRDDIITFTGEATTFATLRGQIVTSPLIITDEDESVRMPYYRPPHMSFILQAGEIKTPAGWQRSGGLVRVTVGEANRKLHAGDEVELIGRLGRSRGSDNPGGIDWGLYARLNRTLVWLSVPSADGATVISSEQSLPASAYWHVRSMMRQHLAQFGDVEEGRLINALITGERHPSLQTLNKAMVHAGIAHFLSVSGQHLAIFLGFVYMLCRLISLSPRRSAAAVLVILAAYLLLAEPNSPLLRSAIMAGALCIATMTGRPYAALNAIAAAALVVLAIDPLELFSAGFQLSFGIVAGMMILHRPIRQMLFGRWLRRRGLTVFRDEHRVRRWLNFSLANWAIAVTTASISAYLVSMPLVAYHFGIVSPYAGLLSVLLGPLVAAVLVPGYLSVALAWLLPNLSAGLGNASAMAAGWLEWAVGACQIIPGLWFTIKPVGVVWTILAYCVIAIIPAWRLIPAPKVVLTAGLSAVLALGVWTQLPADAPAVAEVNILAVGDGQCVLLNSPAGRSYIFDAGSRSRPDTAEMILLPFIRQQKLRWPGQAFVSHANTDHYNAIAPLSQTHAIGRLFINGYFDAPDGGDAQGQTSSSACNLLNALRRQNVEIVHVQAGEKIALDDRVSVEVLWPARPVESPSSVKSANDSSLVLKVTCDGRSILLTGDVEESALQALIHSNANLKCDAMILPHHGSYKPALPALVAAVNPDVVVVSSSLDPRGPASNRQARQFFSQLRTGRAFFSTARNGWIQIRLGRDGLQTQTMR